MSVYRVKSEAGLPKHCKVAKVSPAGHVGKFKDHVAEPKVAKPSKFGNKKTVIDGFVFASKKEAARYSLLKMRQSARDITELELQVEFPLIPSQERADGTKERPVVYRADFCYKEAGKPVVEDSKGYRTPDYIIKRKLMLWVHGITIREV